MRGVWSAQIAWTIFIPISLYSVPIPRGKSSRTTLATKYSENSSRDIADFVTVVHEDIFELRLPESVSTWKSCSQKNITYKHAGLSPRPHFCCLTELLALMEVAFLA